MNEAFERQSGLSRELARGRPIREVLPGIEEDWIEAYCSVATGGPPRRFELYNANLGRHFSVHCFSPTPGRFAVFFSDVTARKRAEEALRERTAVIRAITDTSEDVIYVKDTRGRLVFANPATLALVGKPLDQVLGRTDLEFLEDEAAARQVMENDRRIMERGVAEEVEEHVPLPDGTDRIWASRKAAYRDERGEVVGLIGISRDITGRKRIEDALREADRRKDEFLGMLSHELRNPLAPIRSSTYVLRRAEPGGEQAARALAVIERQTEHLSRLVDDLLDVTRIGRGKIELRRATADLRELVRRATEDFRLLLDDRGVAFTVALPDGPVWAEVDATRVTQVVGNLLHNATKFTRRGDRVSVSLAAAGGQATIAVRDTGAGVERGLLPAIFDPFVQGARSIARTEGGLGLGLALVKGITELHGGAVAADSAGPGRGSEFVVRLPLALPPAPAEPRAAPGERRRAARLVLVVDDNADAADTLAELVRLLGHDVQVAYDGPSALQAARASRPDVVLCDLGLPGMDGYDVARALRAGGGAPLRLVAVSGYAQPDDVRRAADAGFDAHVAKPPDPAEIERLLA
jgi:PAS domain S-box-containing protein